MKVRVGSTCGVNIKGWSVYVTAVPYNQCTIPDEELTGDDAPRPWSSVATPTPGDQQQQLTLFIRATKPGEECQRRVALAGGVPLARAARKLACRSSP
jgi:hypothetical protein